MGRHFTNLKYALLFSSLIINAVICNSPTLFASGVESVNLDYVPLDNSVDCHRILFRSTQHFKQTVFAIPRVVPGNGIYKTGVDSTKIFNIMPSKQKGFYDLAVMLYFPANDENIKTTKASLSVRDRSACNWDDVIASLNKNISEPDEQIQTISNIPLTSIEMKIPGFEKTGRVGSSDTNQDPTILEYYGKSIAVHFEISELERELFESQVVSPTGINSTLLLHFQARSRNGSIQAKVDTSSLVHNFSVDVSVKGLKYLAEGELSAILKSSIQKTSIEISGEEGKSDIVSKVTQQIVDKVMQEVNLASKAAAEENRIKDNVVDKSGAISVAAVIEILSGKINSNISFELFTAPEVATAQLELNFQSDRLNDPNTAEVTVSAQYIDPSSGMFLNAGETITIVPAYWYVDKIIYEENMKYLTMNDLKTLNLKSYFSDLVNEKMVISNQTINDNVMAIGRWHPFSSINSFSYPYSFRWVRIQREAKRYRNSSGIIPANREGLDKVPVYLTFSNLGDRRKTQLKDLMDENEFWSAVYDDKTGRIFLTAKVNLGTVRFRETFRGEDSIGYEKDPVILDEVIEEQISELQNKTTRDYQVLQSDSHAINLQKSVVFNVSRPKKLEGQEKEYVKLLKKKP